MKGISENNLSFQVCRTSDDFKSAEDGYQAVLEGLGRNIVSKIGDVELGKNVQIFIRNKENKVVGGAIGSVFGGWLYISLMWIEESLRNQDYGTTLLKMMENEAVNLGCKHAHVDTYSFEQNLSTRKTATRCLHRLRIIPRDTASTSLRKNYFNRKHV